MSDTDSFIDDVNDEVRRDRLFLMFRRYGWIAVLLIVVLVGGAAWNEWRKASTQARAEAFGDAVSAALEQPTPESRRAALDALTGTPDQRALLAMLSAGDLSAQNPAPADADALRAVAADTATDAVYRDLATLKLSLEDTAMSPADRIALLEPLTVPGAPFRTLALEQTAIAQVAAGDTDVALKTLTDLLAGDQVSEGLRRRATQLIVALGGKVDAA